MGKVKSIGLSNFESERLEEVLEGSRIKPSVLQVECHPYYQQNRLKRSSLFLRDKIGVLVSHRAWRQRAF